MTQPSGKTPSTPHKQEKKKRLSSALRENLKRRKAAPRPQKPAPEAASDAAPKE